MDLPAGKTKVNPAEYNFVRLSGKTQAPCLWERLAAAIVLFRGYPSTGSGEPSRYHSLFWVNLSVLDNRIILKLFLADAMKTIAGSD
jgi:hypothetical protein